MEPAVGTGMRLETLGRLELGDSGFGQRQAKILLAYLALEGRTERSHLAELFWPNARRPLNNLSSAMARLRSVEASLVEAERDSVTAAVEVDADRFSRYLAGGHDEEALALYNGRFLDGLDLTALPAELQEWVLSHRSMFAAAARDGAVRLAESASEAGAVERATAWAERAVDVGADAVLAPELFRSLHRILSLGGSPQAQLLAEEAEEFGVSLSSPITDPASDQKADAGDAGFHGRTDELVAVLDSLAAQRSVVIHGMGGIGKSRLAGQAVSRCGDLYGNAVWIDMAPDPDPNAVQVAESIRASVASHVEQAAGIDGVIEAIGNSPQFLVIENFEFGVSQVDTLERLVEECPRVRMIVVSRIDPAMNEAGSVCLAGLPVSGASNEPGPAVRLLADALARSRAHAIDDDRDRSAAQTVCRLLGGLPLAIELVAGWRHVLSFAEMITELEAGFKLLDTDDPTQPDHHRCYSTVFDRTWSLLEPGDRDVMLRLNAVSGRFRRPLAETVGGADLGSIRRLNRHAMLSCSPEGWFERHPLVVDYTRKRLADFPKVTEAGRQSHLCYIVDEVAKVESIVFSEGPGAIPDLEDDGVNLISAWDRAVETMDWEALRHLIDPIDRTLGRSGNYLDVLERFSAIELCEDKRSDHRTGSPPGITSDLGQTLAMHRVWLLILSGDYQSARNLADDTQGRLADEATEFGGGPKKLASVRVELARARATIDRYEGNIGDAVERLEQIASLVEGVGGRLETLVMEDLGHCQLSEGHYRQAIGSYRAALASVLDGGSTFDVVRNHLALATAMILHRRPIDALAQLATGQELIDEHDLEQMRVHFLSKRATALLDVGDSAGASDALDLGMAELGRGGEEWLRLEFDVTAGRLAILLGDLDRADHYVDQLIDLATALGDTPFLLRGFLLAAEVAFARGDLLSPSVGELLACVAVHDAADHQDRLIAEQMLDQIAQIWAAESPRLTA